MDIKQAIAKVVERQNLSQENMTDVMRAIMTGQTTPAQIAGFLIALRMKGETVDEIVGAATVMRELATKIEIDLPYLVDTCGTGGDTAHLFNVSTAAAFVVAAAGGHVAKHGNRSVSSKSGSADVLEAAGIKIDLGPEAVARCVKNVGVGFLFAPTHHSAMKYAIGPRKEMGVRTIFNLLGPLSNPARVKNQVIGVFDKKWLRPLAEVGKALGSEHWLVVHGSDGLDEISVSAETYVAELHHGDIREYSIAPEQFGITKGNLAQLTVADAAESLALIKKALSKSGGAASDIVALNAGAAIYAANLCHDLAQGVHMAQDAIASGKALEKFNELIQFSHCFTE